MKFVKKQILIKQIIVLWIINKTDSVKPNPEFDRLKKRSVLKLLPEKNLMA
jgi:hypothetical protein